MQGGSEFDGILAGLVLFVTVYVLVLAWVGQLIGNTRGRALTGTVLGGLLGPLGWLIVAFLPRTIEAEARRRVAIRKRVRELLRSEKEPTARAVEMPRSEASAQAAGMIATRV